jgi:hypothetical protein
VGEVHADDVEASLAERVHLLGRVGLGADGTDDGGATVLLRRVVLGVELAEPFDPGSASIEVVETENMLSVGIQTISLRQLPANS